MSDLDSQFGQIETKVQCLFILAKLTVNDIKNYLICPILDKSDPFLAKAEIVTQSSRGIVMFNVQQLETVL